MEAGMDLTSETALEDSSQEKCPEAREITLGRMDLESAFAESASTEKLTVFEEEPAPTQMSSEMEAKMKSLSLGEGSSQEDWENLFRKVLKLEQSFWTVLVWSQPLLADWFARNGESQ